MPPKKQSPEEKEKAFESFKETEEYKQYWRVVDAKEADPEIKGIENSTTDIVADWTKFLYELFRLMEIAKIPHKSKSYEQSVLRTMFFERLSDNKDYLVFDGVHHTVSAGENLDHWNCRCYLVLSVWAKLDREALEDMNASNYKAYKTDLSKMMKEWDKRYVKHGKTTNQALGAIQKLVAVPLTDLFESNFNFYNINQLIKKGVWVPDFRLAALEAKFVQHMKRVQELLRDFGKLEDEFDIQQQLDVLKTKDWENIEPFCFYFMPLRKKLDDVIKCLLDMNKAGPLRCKYVVEQNEELQDKVIIMCKQDRISQWVGSNDIRRDQLRWIYDVIKIMYDSPLRGLLINEEENAKLIEEVIPMFLAYQAVKRLMDIDRKKKIDRENKIDKRLRRGLPAEEPEPEPVEEEEIKPTKKGAQASAAKKKVEVVEEIVPRPTDEDQKTIAEYGRYWMFVNYFSEEEDYMNLWNQAAQLLTRINPAVIQDIEDHILLQGFRTQRNTANQIQAKIVSFLDTQRNRELMVERKNKSEKNPVEEGKEQDKKREFQRAFRPDQHIWNFEEEEDPLPHVLRVDADPAKAYVDGRIEEFLAIIEQIAMHLKTNQKETWDQLLKYELAIFVAKEKAEAAEYQQWATETGAHLE